MTSPSQDPTTVAAKPAPKRGPVKDPSVLPFAHFPTPGQTAAFSWAREPQYGALTRQRQAELERFAQAAGNR